MGWLEDSLARSQVREGARGWERRFVCALMKDSLREGTVGAGAVMAIGWRGCV